MRFLASVSAATLVALAIGACGTPSASNSSTPGGSVPPDASDGSVTHTAPDASDASSTADAMAHDADAAVPAWTYESSGTDESLYAVWLAAPDDVYVVGSHGTILHSRGDGVWAAQPSETTAFAIDVRGSSGQDVYVGAIGVGTNDGGFVAGDLLHSSGNGRWQRADPAVFGSPGGAEIGGIWARSAEDVWLAGNRSNAGNVWHSQRGDGGALAWTEQLLQTEPHAIGRIWGSADGDVYVAAYLLFHRRRDGDWLTETADPRTLDVWGSSPDDVYAIGELAYDVYHSHGDGQWTRESAVRPGAKFWSYVDLWGASAKDLYLVGGGDFADSGAIVHGDGTGSWVLVRDDAPPLYGVAGSSGDNVYFVGARGTILHYRK